MNRVLRLRLTAFGLHLACSAAIGTGVFLLLYGVWYPAPLFELAGGEHLFLLLVSCDVVLGPLLTLVIFNIAKPRRELRRDITIIVLLQLAALLYGTHIMYVARPLYIVYNDGQFNVMLANTLTADDYAKLPRDIPANPRLGPVVIGSVRPADPTLRDAILFSAVGGGPDLYQMPQFYAPYSRVKAEAGGHALTAREFVRRNGGDLATLEAQLAKCATPRRTCGLMPVVLRQAYAVAVVDRQSGEVMAMEQLVAR